MRFRLGYVAMTLKLVDCSPSGTMTVTAFKKLPDPEAALNRVRRIAKKNLENTLRILRYNLAYNIYVYRLTSKLVPLATHPLIEGWDYSGDLKEEFLSIGSFIKENDFRISAHPDHYTILNPESDQVFNESLKDLDYHAKVYEAMGLTDYRYKLVLHIGGLYGNKKASIERFKRNFEKLPERISKRIILENDDKVYTAADVLDICNDLGVPMVLDVHHHNCNNNYENLEELLPHIFKTWDGQHFNPKVHFSSPKSTKEFRHHADNIELQEFLNFLRIASKTDRDFDVMLEAKNKDGALLKLSDELKDAGTVKSINQAEFELKK
ncbi:MAG: UV DNA damage repair endonuclease UvsE [Bacillota bacterium]|nr:UV DNA damage repair endonuclease UvsE [Bacillota bacterium]